LQNTKYRNVDCRCSTVPKSKSIRIRVYAARPLFCIGLGPSCFLCKIVAGCVATSGLARPLVTSLLCDYKALLFPLAHNLNCILPSTLFCLCSLPSPLTGRAAQPPEFSPRDVVGLIWSPLAIPPPSRLAALIRPFLEPNFPRRWSDSDVGVDARPGQPGRSLPNPAPGLSPPLSLFPSAILNGLLSVRPTPARPLSMRPDRYPLRPLFGERVPLLTILQKVSVRGRHLCRARPKGLQATLSGY
jgi:hypothetical protein